MCTHALSVHHVTERELRLGHTYTESVCVQSINPYTQIYLKIANNNIIVAKSTDIYSNFAGYTKRTNVDGQWNNVVGRFRIISNYCYVYFV